MPAGYSPHFQGQESMASQEYASVRSKAQLERLTVLRRVVSFLCSEGTGGWSFASLSATLDIPEERLRKEFGTEEALLDDAAEMFQDVVLAALTEPLQTARTGREAVHGMLEMAISLRKGYRRLKDRRAGVRSLARERVPDAQAIDDCGKSLEYQIRERLERSVYEGELPESANARAMCVLTLAIVIGLLFCSQEDLPGVTLLDTARLFVDGLGFHVARPPKRRSRRLAPVLEFVRRPVS